MTSRVNGPITVAIVDDYDVVVMGLADMFDQYRDRVVVAELDSNEALVDTVDYRGVHETSMKPASMTAWHPFWKGVQTATGRQRGHGCCWIWITSRTRADGNPRFYETPPH